MKKHKPLFPESPEYKEFLTRMEEFENILIKKRKWRSNLLRNFLTYDFKNKISFFHLFLV